MYILLILTVIKGTNLPVMDIGGKLYVNMFCVLE